MGEALQEGSVPPRREVERLTEWIYSLCKREMSWNKRKGRRLGYMTCATCPNCLCTINQPTLPLLFRGLLEYMI